MLTWYSRPDLSTAQRSSTAYAPTLEFVPANPTQYWSMSHISARHCTSKLGVSTGHCSSITTISTGHRRSIITYGQRSSIANVSPGSVAAHRTSVPDFARKYVGRYGDSTSSQIPVLPAASILFQYFRSVGNLREMTTVSSWVLFSFLFFCFFLDFFFVGVVVVSTCRLLCLFQ